MAGGWWRAEKRRVSGNGQILAVRARMEIDSISDVVVFSAFDRNLRGGVYKAKIPQTAPK